MFPRELQLIEKTPPLNESTMHIKVKTQPAALIKLIIPASDEGTGIIVMN